MPAVQDLVKSMTGKQPNMSVNPDEVVAADLRELGAENVVVDEHAYVVAHSLWG